MKLNTRHDFARERDTKASVLYTVQLFTGSDGGKGKTVEHREWSVERRRVHMANGDDTKKETEQREEKERREGEGRRREEEGKGVVCGSTRYFRCVCIAVL